MIVYVHCAKCVGIDAVPVTVEVDITNGIGIHLVGLADAAVKESLLRTVTALQACGFRVPGKKIIINLAPADLHKNGSGYDLPIAIGIIAASGQRDLPVLEKHMIMGELGLDGSIRYVSGALPLVELARKDGFEGCILPIESALEATEYTGIDIYGVETLSQALEILEGKPESDDYLVWNSGLFAKASEGRDSSQDSFIPDFADLVGLEAAKRGAEISCAGNHNMIMVGPPGSGKSSLAKAMAGILPPMTPEESLITSKIYSVAGKHATRCGFMKQRPFRAPHNRSSLAALLGGGTGDNILPGEISLATNGVLFLDEFAETPKSLMEALRAPLEDRRITISRLKSKLVYPADFMLVAASNPCPCGYYGEGGRCRCSPGQRAAYIGRLSGPLMDRIDLQVWVSSPSASELLAGDRTRSARETSDVVAKRIAAARKIQQRRFEGTGIFTNAGMSGRDLKQYCPLTDDCKELLENIILKMGMSARAYTRILKVARTIADLDAVISGISPDRDAGPILPAHISEAASYRFLDRRDLLDL